MNKTMIVVADSSRARIFTWADDEHSALTELEDMSHPEAHLHERDITSDLGGMDSGVSGAGSHIYESKVSPKKQQQVEFAKRVTSYIDDARKANRLSKLLLIVAPEFLGELRSEFSNELGKLVVYESAKNIASHTMADIMKHIPRPAEYRKIS